MNNKDKYAVGFAWGRADRTTDGGWLRDLAIGLAVASAAALLLMVGDSYAQERTIQISGASRTATVTVPIGKSQDVRTATSFVDVMVGDPEVAMSIRSPTIRCRFSARRSAPPGCRSIPSPKS